MKKAPSKKLQYLTKDQSIEWPTALSKTVQPKITEKKKSRSRSKSKEWKSKEKDSKVLLEQVIDLLGKLSLNQDTEETMSQIL